MFLFMMVLFFCGFSKILPHKLLLYHSHCFTHLFSGSQYAGEVLTHHIFYSIHLLPCSCPSSNQLSNQALVASGEWVICFPYNFSSADVKCANLAVSWKGLMY